MQRFPAEAELFQHTGAEVLDQDVRPGEQLPEDRQAVRVLEIEGERFLVARLDEPPQRGALIELAPLAQRIAAVGRLDLDHLGAELRTEARSEGAGDQTAEFDHLQAGEGFGWAGHDGVASVGLAMAATLEHFHFIQTHSQPL